MTTRTISIVGVAAGTQLVVSIPAEHARELKWKKGMKVECAIDIKNESITYKKK